MENLIEHIARHADADTRRAMGFGDIDLRMKLRFPPRKLPLPHLNLPFEFEYSGKTHAAIRFRNAALYIYHPRESTAWVFDTSDTYRYCSLYMRRGKIVISTRGCEWENSHHPDINDDGSLRAWRT